MIPLDAASSDQRMAIIPRIPPYIPISQTINPLMLNISKLNTQRSRDAAEHKEGRAE